MDSSNSTGSETRKFIIEDVIIKDNERAEPCLVQFSNGVVQKPSDVKARLYRNASQKFTQRRKQRILYATTPHLSYKGKNFGKDVQNEFKEQLFLGVLDKETNRMKLVEMSHFLLHPEIESFHEDRKMDDSEDEMDKNKRKALNQNFGGRRGRIMNKKRMESEINITDMSGALQDAFEKADAQVLPEDTEEQDSNQNILPKCDKNATILSDVYRLEDIIVDEELVEYNDDAIKWIDGEGDPSTKSPLFNRTISNIKLFSSDEERQAKMVCVAMYTENLIHVVKSRVNQPPVFKLCPKRIQTKILSEFTVGKSGKRTAFLQDKLIAHILILSLISNQFAVPTQLMSQSMGVKLERLINVSKVVGATVEKNTGSLVLRFPLFKIVTRPKKFKKM